MFDVKGKAGPYTEPLRKLDPLIYDLRRLRYARGISQSELARRIDCSAKTIKSAEAGTSNPDYVVMHAWARALGMKLTLTVDDRKMSR